MVLKRQNRADIRHAVGATVYASWEPDSVLLLLPPGAAPREESSRDEP